MPLPLDPKEKNRLLLRAFSRDSIFFMSTVFGGPGQVFYRPFVKFHKRTVERIEATKKPYAVTAIPREFGKALDVCTPIPVPDGWKAMGDLEVGDKVFDENGKVCNVTFVTDIQHDRKCYRVEFSDGSSIVADADHQWYVKDRYSIKDGGFKVLTTRGMIDRVFVGNRVWSEHRYSIPMTKPLDLAKKDLPIDPYVLGVWLGDGTSAINRLTISDGDLEILDHIRDCGYEVEKANQPITYIVGKRKDGNKSLKTVLSELGLINNKHIPDIYLRSSVEQRFELLRGIMDTDGSISKRGYCEICIKKNGLSSGVEELLSTLGIKYVVKDRMVLLNGKECGPYSRITFSMNSDISIFKLKRKLSRVNKNKITMGSKNIFITGIHPVESVPVKCIQVDSPNSLYLAGKRMTATHNTKLLSLGYVVWRIMFRKTRYVLHISYCEKKGKQVLRDIKRAFKSKRFMRIFGDLQGQFWSQTMIHLHSDKWGVDCIVQIAGAEQSSFGLSEWKSRPDLIIMDDIETLDTVKNKDIIKALEDKFNTEIVPAAEAGDEYGRPAKIIIIGTPLAAHTFLTGLMEVKEDVELIKYPAIVDSRMVPGMGNDLGLPEGVSIWEERWSTEWLMRRKQFYIRRNAYQTWLTQYMLDAKTSNPMQFSRDKLREIEFKDIQPELLNNKVVATVDMAYTKTTSNDAVGITVALHRKGARITYLESEMIYCTANELFERLWQLKRKYSKCAEYKTAIESKVFELVKLYFWEVQMRTGRSLEIINLPDKSRNKDDRIGRMIPYYETGLMDFVKGKNDPLLAEMFDWYGTSRGKDNVIDAAAYQIDHVELSDEQIEEEAIEREREMEADFADDDDFSVVVPDKRDMGAVIKRCDALQRKRIEEERGGYDGEYPAWLDNF